MFPPMTPTTERARIQNEARLSQLDSAPPFRINVARFVQMMRRTNRKAGERKAAQVAARRAESNTPC